MRSLTAPLLIISALTLASATAIAVPRPAKAPPVVAASPAKREACARTWRAQKTHAGDRDRYMKACVTKG